MAFKDQKCKFSSYIYLNYVILSRVVVPLIQGFEDAGDFTISERLKTSVHVNLVFYLIVGSVGLFGLILLIMMHKRWLVLILLTLVVLMYIIVFCCENLALSYCCLVTLRSRIQILEIASHLWG